MRDYHYPFQNCHYSFLKRSSEKSRGLCYWHIPQYVLSNKQKKMGGRLEDIILDT